MAKSKSKNKSIKKQIDKKTGSNEMKDKVITILKILAGVLAFIVVTVLVTKLVNGDFKKDDEETTYNEIVAGQIFNRPEETYYVALYSYEEDSSIDTYIEQVTKTRIYKVNLDDKMNNSVIGEENITTDLNKFKVQNPTLLKIENKKIVETIKEDDISMYLSELSYREGNEE